MSRRASISSLAAVSAGSILATICRAMKGSGPTPGAWEGPSPRNEEESRDIMSFKNPTYQDRVGQAASAKQKALEQLRQKPPRDEKLVAERIAAAEKRDAAK